MDVRQNARSTPRRRAEIVRRALMGQRRASVAAAVGVSEPTVRKRVARYRAEAEAGLRDRSCRPHRSPAATPRVLVSWVEQPLGRACVELGYVEGSIIGRAQIG